MSVRNGMIEAPFEQDYLRVMTTLFRAFHKPIKLNKVYNTEHFRDLYKNRFWQLACQFDSQDKYFDFNNMDLLASSRFVELLASLTLYHFSFSSKTVYHECLNIRGLEFYGLHDFYKIGSEHMCLQGYEGKWDGYLSDEKWRKYCIYFGQFTAPLTTFVALPPERFNFVKKFKMLQLTFELHLIEEHMTRVCKTLFGPEVEHVHIVLSDLESGVYKLPLSKLTELFTFCQKLKNLSFYDFAESNKKPFVNAPFPQVKEMIETWSVAAINLETFILRYTDNFFQLYNHQLKRCVKTKDTYYWNDECDIDRKKYKRYDIVDLYEKLHNFPSYVLMAYYENILCHCKNVNYDQSTGKTPEPVLNNACFLGVAERVKIREELALQFSTDFAAKLSWIAAFNLIAVLLVFLFCAYL